MELVYNIDMEQVISLGWVQVYLFSLIILFAFLWFGFVFFKKAKESRVDDELSLDTILLAGLLAAVMARVVFMLGNLDVFGGSWIRGVFLKEYPGMSGLGAVLGLVLAILIVVKKTKEKVFDWLDLASLALAAALPVVEAGRLVAGQGGMIWGKVPEMGVGALLLLILFWFLWRVEKEYRTFEWYRQHKTQANSGFVTAGLMLGYGVYKILMLLLLGGSNGWQSLWWGLGFLLIGGGLMYWRSGRKIVEKEIKWRELPAILKREIRKKTRNWKRGINK